MIYIHKEIVQNKRYLKDIINYFAEYQDIIDIEVSFEKGIYRFDLIGQSDLPINYNNYRAFTEDQFLIYYLEMFKTDINKVLLN